MPAWRSFSIVSGTPSCSLSSTAVAPSRINPVSSTLMHSVTLVFLLWSDYTVRIMRCWTWASNASSILPLTPPQAMPAKLDTHSSQSNDTKSKVCEVRRMQIDKCVPRSSHVCPEDVSVHMLVWICDWTADNNCFCHISYPNRTVGWSKLVEYGRVGALAQHQYLSRCRPQDD